VHCTEGGGDAEYYRSRAIGQFQHTLEVFNVSRYETYNHDMASAVSAVYNSAKYMRLDGHGPKVGPFSDRYGLCRQGGSGQLR
jgi:hypothetical protein